MEMLGRYLDNANGRFSGAAWIQARHRHTATCEQLCAHMIDKVSWSHRTALYGAFMTDICYITR
jgi:hypothetical protein